MLRYSRRTTPLFATESRPCSRWPTGERIERELAPIGKVALTSYLLQSVVLGVMFTGYGFGLVDQLAPLAVIAIVPVVFVAQMLLGRWWLSGHAYGPVEWVLRAIPIAGIPPFVAPSNTKVEVIQAAWVGAISRSPTTERQRRWAASPDL
ncbi:MAG: DUF418 domain-containing protein [Actinomycetota bacterium]|nr:DUF418 domain-containing protein [Actinomycetota bacterium]